MRNKGFLGGTSEDWCGATVTLWDTSRKLMGKVKFFGNALLLTEPLHRWGLIDLVRELNEETTETASGVVKAAALHHLGMIHPAQGGTIRLGNCTKRAWK